MQTNHDIGSDIAKSVFQFTELYCRGEVVMSTPPVEGDALYWRYFPKLPPCLVGH